jgi:Flp pilus assembly pilin Flp
MGSQGLRRRLIDDRCGVTGIEYGLIAVTALVVLGTAGTDLINVFGQIAGNLSGERAGGG